MFTMFLFNNTCPSLRKVTSFLETLQKLFNCFTVFLCFIRNSLQMNTSIEELDCRRDLILHFAWFYPIRKRKLLKYKCWFTHYWCLYRHQCDPPERFGKIDLWIASLISVYHKRSNITSQTPVVSMTTRLILTVS